ncbi:MAG: family transcriptional regulator [Bacilli bacterium]|nr:family transcriptional regulator [Bacilli bacterium]
MKRTGDQKLMKELNRSIVLKTIRNSGSIYRGEIAKMNNLSPTTVASAISELIKEGIVEEIGMGLSSGGRRPIMVRISQRIKFMIGVSVTTTGLTIAEMNFEAKIKNKQVFQFGFNSKNGGDTLDFILDKIEQFTKQFDDLSSCIGISIISPGIVGVSKSMVTYSSKFWWTDIPLAQLIEDRVHLKAWVENDVNAIALAELYLGYHDHCDNLLYINTSFVGAGIILNGQIFRGHNGGSGEIGHMTIDKGGIPCDCGNKGCLEKYVGWPAIETRIMDAIAAGRQSKITELISGDLKELTPTIVRKAMEFYDQLTMEVITDVAEYFAAAIGNLVNILNPQVIVLYDEYGILPIVKDYVSKNALSPFTQSLEILPSFLGEDYQLLGAASVILQDVLHFNISS